jgi:hypothetical protein
MHLPFFIFLIVIGALKLMVPLAIVGLLVMKVFKA